MALSKINRMKFGIIDEVYMNTIADAVDTFLEIKPSIENTIEKVSRLPANPFFATITKVTPSFSIDLTRFDGTVSLNVRVQWVYEWSSKILETADEASVVFGNPEVVVTSEDVTNSIPDNGGQGGEVLLVSGLAINLAEMANLETAPIVFGVDMSSAVYPNGFIPVGMQVGDYVSLQKSYASDGAIIYFFDRQGTHDGICSE